MEKSEMEDDIVMESLQRCMDELKRAKLDYPGPPPPDELPKMPFGSFTEPTFEQKVRYIAFFFMGELGELEIIYRFHHF